MIDKAAVERAWKIWKLSQTEPEYHEMLMEIRETEKKYEEALDLLPKEQEATIRDFVSLCEAMSWRMLQIACSLMCFSNGSNTEHSAQTTESLTELSW